MLLPLESALRQEENERVQIPILKLREQNDNIRCKQSKQIALALCRNKQDPMQAYYIPSVYLDTS